MKVVAIIQARMGSSRLPGKMMMDLGGHPVIENVFERLRPSKIINEIWLATSNKSDDDILVKWAEQHKVNCFRGSENDVLDRYYQTALLAKAEIIVRITGDCPLHDYQVIDKVVAELNFDYDYVSNVWPPTFPDGLDVEVFNFESLKKAWREAELKSEREHVTPYIWKHPEIFRLKNVANEVDLSNQRWTLDTKEDLELLRLIVGECQKNNRYCGLLEILEILRNHPEWLKINAKYQRNEGYQISLKKDNYESNN